MGCVSYLVSVILMTYETLRQEPGAQWLSVIIGLMSTSTVIGTAIILALDKPDDIEKTMRIRFVCVYGQRGPGASKSSDTTNPIPKESGVLPACH